MPFIFRGCQGGFQHLKEKEDKKHLHFPPSLPTLSLCSLLSPPHSLLTSLPVGAVCWGRDARERFFKALRAPASVGGSPGQRQGCRCDGGGEDQAWWNGTRDGGGEPGLAGAAVLGGAGGCRRGSAGSLQKGALAPKFAPAPGDPTNSSWLLQWKSRMLRLRGELGHPRGDTPGATPSLHR